MVGRVIHLHALLVEITSRHHCRLLASDLCYLPTRERELLSQSRPLAGRPTPERMRRWS